MTQTQTTTQDQVETTAPVTPEAAAGVTSTTAEAVVVEEKEDWNSFVSYQGNAAVFKTKKPKHVEPIISIYSDGRFGFNPPVLELLGHPKALVISFNTTKGILSFHAPSKEDTYVFPLPATAETATNVRIGGGRILRAINYPINRDQKVEIKEFTPIFKDGRCLLDISAVLKEAAANNQGQTNNTGSEGEIDETDEEDTTEQE